MRARQCHIPISSPPFPSSPSPVTHLIDSPWVPDNLDLDININVNISISSYSAKSFPGTLKNFKGSNLFLDTFDANIHTQEHKSNIFYPFANPWDWEISWWITLSGLSMLEVDKFLSMQLVGLLCLSLSVLTPQLGSTTSTFIFECQETKAINQIAPFWPALKVCCH